MTVQEMIEQIRNQLHDITDEYDDSVLMKYINTGIKSASSILASVNHSLVLEEKDIADGDNRPDGFLRFAGVYPIDFVNNRCRLGYGVTFLPQVRYYAYKPNVTSVTDNLPFDDENVLLFIEQYASILALNRNEFEIGNDNAILQSFKDELLANIKAE